MKTKVRELRTAAGLTQQQLADLVHVSSRTIISIEKEQYSPSLMLAYRLSLALGLLGYVFTKNLVFGCLFLFSGLFVTLEAVVGIAAAVHYERRL